MNNEDKEICDICGKAIEKTEVYHIGHIVGHLECFEQAIGFYLSLSKEAREWIEENKNSELVPWRAERYV